MIYLSSILGLSVLWFILIESILPNRFTGSLPFCNALSSSSPIPPPPSLSVPVWSLAVSAEAVSNDTDNNSISTESTNMNIMTYCMPVSIGPPKLWALSIFKGTLTKEDENTGEIKTYQGRWSNNTLLYNELTGEHFYAQAEIALERHQMLLNSVVNGDCDIRFSGEQFFCSSRLKILEQQRHQADHQDPHLQHHKLRS